MRTWNLPLLLGCLGLAACAYGPEATAASAGADPAQNCFWTQNVNGFSAVDEDTVNLRVGVRDIYQLELLGACPDIDWSQKIALEARGSSYICTGLDATIIAPSPIGPQRCPVKTVRRLTADEIAALPRRALP